MGQGCLLHHGEYGGPLGGVLFQKLLSGGGVIEQVPHHHGGALGTARLLHLAGHAPLHRQGCPQGGVGGAGEHLHPGHGADGGQSLAPKAQGADGL